MTLKVFNTNGLNASFIQSDPSLATLLLGSAVGTQGLYVNIDRVSPGAKSCKYHSHSKQEEFFLILSGSGQLRYNDENLAVKAGDFFAKPAGQGNAHQFINNSSEVLEILDVGLPDADDEIYYPDEEVTLSKQRAFRQGLNLLGWSSDPNE